MIKINPFDNEFQRQIWFSLNCKKCTKSDCYLKKMLLKAIPITKNLAKRIGYDRDKLQAQCNEIEFSNAKIKKKQKPAYNFHYKMF